MSFLLAAPSPLLASFRPRAGAPCLLQPLQTSTPQRCVIAQGRRDGNKAHRAPRRRPDGRRAEPQPADGGPAWWEDDNAPSTSAPRPSPQRPQQNSSRRAPRAERQDDDGKGWWEVPEERSLQAYAPEELQSWQVARLEQAFATGRKKVKIMELANELELDRSQVLYWMKEFALRPEGERKAIIAERLAEMQADREAEAAEQRYSQPANEPAAVGINLGQQGPGSSSKAKEEPKGEGFIPFYTRKEMGMLDPKHKKLPADALRTLESIYTRTPFPSKDVIRGLWDLHRINRETATDWFSKRREQDGIRSSEQRRRPVKGAGEGLDLDAPGSMRDMGPIGVDDNNMLVQLMGGAAAAEQRAALAASAPQEPQVVKVSAKQLALLRSSLPSPNKYKGRKRSEAMGVKTEEGTLQLGNIQYVQQEEGESGAQVARWARGWRSLRARSQAKMLPLVVRDDE